MGCWKSVTVGGSRGVSLIKVITVNDQENKGMNTFENTEQTLTEHSLGQISRINYGQQERGDKEGDLFNNVYDKFLYIWTFLYPAM